MHVRRTSFIAIGLLIMTALLYPKTAAAQTEPPKCLWEICSVDVMKTSRDRARENINNPGYDRSIEAQVKAVRETGANYIAIGTPYDEEFMPYLKRWVAIAREQGLKIWFRGNWSNWEGWFEYPKNMTPDQHLAKTSAFITTHSDLFADGDIFDACPECENSFLWPQTAKDQEYRDYIKAQHASASAAFKTIGKDVRTDIPTIIGGRARDVLDQETLDDLHKTVAIDHYVKDRENMTKYIDHFSQNFNTKVLVSEFGAPIPDINGDMTESEQAAFVDEILHELYAQKENVIGLNYFVLTEGSTHLINGDGSKREVYDVLRKYFSPGKIQGRVVNTLGDPIEGITIKSSDTVAEAKTNRNGHFEMVLPASDGSIEITDDTYGSSSAEITFSKTRTPITKNFTLRPTNPSTIYKIREFFKKTKMPL